MTMSFLLHDHFDSTESYSPASPSSPRSPKSAFEDVHILAEKLEIPDVSGLVERPRLMEMLERSLGQFAATLVSGRAGTGKTAMAAAFAQTRPSVVWCTIESSDVEWNVFAHYLAAGVLQKTRGEVKADALLPDKADSSPNTISLFLLNLVAELEKFGKDQRPLIVLDGVHHLFDTDWFGGFFSVLLPSLSGTADLLFLCRSKPPHPLWRLRSKQQLDVIDEKVIAFTRDEAIELFRSVGRSASEATRRQAETFGRISKLLKTCG